MIPGSPVWKEKDPGIIRLCYFPGQTCKIEVQLLCDQYNSNYYRRYHKQCLQGIRPDNGLYPSPEGIEPDQQDGNHYGCPEGYIPAAENTDMQNTGNQKQAEGGPDNSLNKEEKSSCLVGPPTESAFQVSIDGSKV